MELELSAFHVVLSGVVGSTAYGLAHQGSDIDRLGVFVAPTVEVLGLDGPARTSQSYVSHDPDVTLHELGKYASLALKANPTVLELLFLPSFETVTPTGAKLVESRHAFLSTNAVRAAYGGYATAQAHRLERRAAEGREGFSSDTAKRTAKHARHCFRLLHSGASLLSSGELVLDVSDIRDEIFEVGELAVADPPGFRRLFDDRLAALDAVDSILPDEPDRTLVDDLVVTARLAHL
jgi:predicted nucleotidyltransferase